MASGITAFTIGIREPRMRLVRITTADGESVEFESAQVIIRHAAEGVRITPSKIRENVLGFLTLFFPWNEIRQIKEYESE